MGFWFAIFSAFTGETIYQSNLIPLFNVFFAAAPILVLASLDQDVSADSSLEYPELYFDGQENREFNVQLFVVWVATGIFHSAVIFFGSVAVFAGTAASSIGQTSGVWTLGAVVYTNVVLVVNAKVALEVKNWTWLNVISLVISIAMWFIMLIFASTVPSLFPETYWVAFQLFADPRYWLSMILIPTAALIPDFSYMFLRRQLYPRRVHCQLGLCLFPRHRPVLCHGPPPRTPRRPLA